MNLKLILNNIIPMESCNKKKLYVEFVKSYPGLDIKLLQSIAYKTIKEENIIFGIEKFN